MATVPADTQFQKTDFPDSGLSSQDSLDKFFTPLNRFFSDVRAALQNGLTIAQNAQSELVTLNIHMPDTDWQTISWAANWSDVAGTTSRYRLDQAGIVYFEIRVAAGASATGSDTPFTFPAAYRPSQQVDGVAVGPSSTGFRWFVNAAGQFGFRVDGGTFGAGNYLVSGSFTSTARAPGTPSNFPIAFKTTRVTSPIGFRLLRAQDVTAKSRSSLAAPILSLGVPDVALLGGGSFRLQNLPGLALGRDYAITLEAIGG